MVINVFSIVGHNVATCAKSQPKASQKLHQNIKRSIYTLTKLKLLLKLKLFHNEKQPWEFPKFKVARRDS